MSKQVFSNIDYTNTAAYKTAKALNDEGIFDENKLQHYHEFGQLQRLRKVDSLLQQDKGIKKIIKTMSRQIIKQQEGRTNSKEYLIIGGDTFSYEEFTKSTIEELRQLSKTGSAAKGPGYHLDRDGKLRDREGTSHE